MTFLENATTNLHYKTLPFSMTLSQGSQNREGQGQKGTHPISRLAITRMGMAAPDKAIENHLPDLGKRLGEVALTCSARL